MQRCISCLPDSRFSRPSVCLHIDPQPTLNRPRPSIKPDANPVIPPGIHAENVYAQDPAFNELDRALLSSLDIRVVEHPQAFDLIGASTFVFAPHCERLFFYPGLEGKDPAMVICNSFEDLIDGYLPLSPPLSCSRWSSGMY